MNADNNYRVNAADVMHETIDGEVVLINMVTGAYYSIDPVGAVIWNILATTTSNEAIVDQVSTRYTGERNDIAIGVTQFLEELKLENLLLNDGSGTPASAPAPTAGPTVGQEAAADPQPFRKPVIQKFTDMQELLLLDPIHEADETGWPRTAPTPEKPANNPVE